MCHLDWLRKKYHSGLCYLDHTLSKAPEGALNGMEIYYYCVDLEFKYLRTQKEGFFIKCNDFPEH